MRRSGHAVKIFRRRRAKWLISAQVAWAADKSAAGLRRSWGVNAHYEYVPGDLDANAAAYAATATPAAAPDAAPDAWRSPGA